MAELERPITHSFLNKGRPYVLSTSGRHTHRAPVGAKGEAIIDRYGHR